MRFGAIGKRAASAAASIAILGVLSACTHAGGAAVATVNGAAPATTAGQSGFQQRELAFKTCMWKAGIDMPDPDPGDTTGRSAIRYELDVKGQGSNPVFQAALDACIDLLPPVPAATPAPPGVLARELKFARCMRDHGVKNYPDPNPDGSMRANWISESDKIAVAAVKTCDRYLPAASPSASTSS